MITTARDALAHPGLLVLSAWYHTRRGGALRDTMIALLAEVIGTLSEIDPEQARRYHWLALEILPAPTARRLKQMTMTMSDLVQHAMKKYYPGGLQGVRAPGAHSRPCGVHPGSPRCPRARRC